MTSGPMIITIDGPAGAGKSTVAKRLSRILNIAYLDTGAMYRALTLKAMTEGLNLEDEDQLVQLARRSSIDLEENTGQLKVLLDGRDVSQEIRTLEVTNKTFYIARAPRVREIMVEWQRQMGLRKGIVAEGRDIGTVVFPHAPYKFYLDANVEERTRRRVEELKAKGTVVNEGQLKNEIVDRDMKDSTRSAGPLKKADDAVFIDSSRLSVDEVVQTILKYVHSDASSSEKK